MLNLKTGQQFKVDNSTVNLQPQPQPLSRRSALKGLAAILAASSAPALLGQTARGLMHRNLGGRLASMGGGAKPYDREVDYISSDGTRTLTLWFGFDTTDIIETEFCITTPLNVADKYINSPTVWNSSGSNRFGMGRHGSTAQNMLFTGSFGSVSTIYSLLLPYTSYDFDIRKWTYNDWKFEVPDIGLIKDYKDSVTFSGTTTNIRLFWGYNSGTAGKIKSYKHIKVGGVGCDLIAVEKDGQGWLYDRAKNNPSPQRSDHLYGPFSLPA